MANGASTKATKNDGATAQQLLDERKAGIVPKGGFSSRRGLVRVEQELTRMHLLSEMCSMARGFKIQRRTSS